MVILKVGQYGKEPHTVGYSFRLTVRNLLYALSHKQDNTSHDLWYTSCGELVERDLPLGTTKLYKFWGEKGVC